MKRVLAIFDKTPLWAVILAYPFGVVAILVLSIILFFFPILPICALLNIEFSNLGPIATFFWGLLFDIFVLTPVFLILFSLKIARILYARHTARSRQQGT